MTGKLVRIWPVIVSFAVLAVGYGVMKNTLDKVVEEGSRTEYKIENHADRIARLEAMEPIITEMRSDIKELVRNSRTIERRTRE